MPGGWAQPRAKRGHHPPVDLYSRTVQIYEKQEWWLRDILRKRDGLCT